MTSRLFRVDMSEGSRDFMAVATEPGLAMLDGTGANYAIFRRWLGILVAEPELQNSDLVSFYVRDPERGRLENVACQPVTQKDLRGPLKEELEAIAAGIRKAKPESSNERLLHKIAAKTLKDQTADLDKSDFDCYFFKYRQGGGPWHLVWCWGYQRRDHEPSRAVICSNQDCHRLYAHRPKTKRRCPACQTVTLRAGRGPLAGVGLTTWLLLLLIAGLLFAFFCPTQLVVAPGQWSGPPGSRVDFQVAQQRWLFFKSDVTGQVIPQSDDPRIMEFDRTGVRAHAKGQGRTRVGFLLGDQIKFVAVEVGPVRPPQAIRIEPATVQVGVGSTVSLKAMGTYADGPPVDVTEQVQWELADPKVAFVRNGRLEGTNAGKTKLTARYPASEGTAALDATGDVEVATIEYKSLELKIEPASAAVGQSMHVAVTARDAAGKSYDMLGSSKVTLSIDPYASASIENEYILGKAPGNAKLTAVLGNGGDKLTQTKEFFISGAKAGTLAIRPAQVDMVVGEYINLEIAGINPADLQSVSSSPAVVVVLGSRTLSAHSPGEAEVQFTQGNQQQTVKVSVKPSNFRKVEIRPAAITMAVGETRHFDVVGITADGLIVNLASDQVKWLRQPQDTSVELRRNTFELQGKATTSTPQQLEAQFAELPSAVATVSVSAAPVAVASAPDVWGVYPPVSVSRQGTVVDLGTQIGGGRLVPGTGLVIDKLPSGSPLIAEGIVPGSVISTIDGRDIRGLPAAEVVDLLKQHPLGTGSVISVAGPDGVGRDVRLGPLNGIIELSVKFLGITTSNVTASTFDAAVQVSVDSPAEYRVVDKGFKPLSPWSKIGPGVSATLNASQIPRAAGLLKYDMYVERQLAGDVTRYPFVISLNPK